MPGTVTRFAPSPTGLLHLGGAYAALFAERAAREDGGRFLVRIEDIDLARCRPEHETAILDDLGWLGLAWETPVRRQSEHMNDYARAIERLRSQGLIYPCFCSRRDIARSATAPHGPDGPLYPGTCRRLGEGERAHRTASGVPFALRLDVARALQGRGPIAWHDRGAGRIEAYADRFGDIVLGRRDVGTSYHLAVVVDDALQGVTLVTRGQDLFEATGVQRLLQVLLDLPEPEYHHHPLVLDETGRRFAKRDVGATIAGLRAAGATAREVRARLGFD